MVINIIIVLRFLFESKVGAQSYLAGSGIKTVNRQLGVS